jgi:hypothetical protein
MKRAVAVELTGRLYLAVYRCPLPLPPIATKSSVVPNSSPETLPGVLARRLFELSGSLLITDFNHSMDIARVRHNDGCVDPLNL